ncbi:MAG: flavin reductase [Clostridia bacterium]|nr:flavin reductase [Clostridia bacterium]
MSKDPKAMFSIGYGLYVLTSKDEKDSGCIVNAVMQLTSSPEQVAVAVNKSGYTHDLIVRSGKLNINVLSAEAPFSLFERFGFQSGRTVDKFDGFDFWRTENGLTALTGEFCNSVISLEVKQSIDMGTHTLFIGQVTESAVLMSRPSMTYAYYHANVKPKPETKKKGWVCKICGYVYEGETLPEDFVCPWCKHPASDFEPIK